MTVPLAMTDHEMSELLRARCRKRGAQTALAMELGISPAMLTRILTGHRRVGDAALAKLGYRRIELLVPVMDDVKGEANDECV